MKIKKVFARLIIISLTVLMSIFVVSCSSVEEESVKDEIVVESDESVEETTENTISEQDMIPEVLGEMYTTDKVNVRVEASMNGEVYCTLNSHEVVQVTEIGNDWTSVLIDNNVYYISSQYLREKVEGKNGFLIVIDEQNNGYNSINYVAECFDSATFLGCYLDNSSCSIAF